MVLTFVFPLTCTEFARWTQLLWQMALSRRIRSWTAAPMSEQLNLRFLLLKPCSGMCVCMSGFQFNPPTPPPRLQNVNFHLSIVTWPSSSSSSKPLLWSFQSLPLPDTLEIFCPQTKTRYFKNVAETRKENIEYCLNFFVYDFDWMWFCESTSVLSQLTVASGLSMESTGWSKVRWTSHPLSLAVFAHLNKLTNLLINAAMTNHDMWRGSDCKKSVPSPVFLCLVHGHNYHCANHMITVSTTDRMK